MIRTLGKDPVKYILRGEQEAENPTIFWIKPMTYADFQEDVALVKLENKDGNLSVANQKELDKKFFQKYIKKIENIEVDGEVKTIENPEEIYKVIESLPADIGTEIKNAVEEISTILDQKN